MSKKNVNEVSERERCEIIGRRVLANQEKRRQRNAEMYNTWLAEGQQFKTAREQADISQVEVSKAIGANESVIRRFETGLFVMRRPVIKASYVLALEAITLRRLNIINALYNTQIVGRDNSSSENATN